MITDPEQSCMTTRSGSNGLLWVCVRQAHPPEDDDPDAKGVPDSERHLFVAVHLLLSDGATTT